jgi:hypothetical protein
VWEQEVVSFVSGYGPVVGVCKGGTEHSDSKQSRDFVAQLRDYYCLRVYEIIA